MAKFEIEKGTSTEILRSAASSANPVGVDRENNVIKGYIVAQRGQFKTGRGEFSDQSLAAIAKLMNASGGVPSNYGHQQDPGSSATLDAFIGVAKNARVDGDKVRADLHLSPVAMLPDSTGHSRGERLMLRAESAPGSFGSSLVLMADKQFRLDNRGHRKTDQQGNVLAPIWMPTAISGSDVVAIGDATNGFLASDAPDESDELIRARWRNKKRKLGA